MTGLCRGGSADSQLECLSRLGSSSFRIALGRHPFANHCDFEQNVPHSEFRLFAAFTVRCLDHDLRRRDQSSSCTKGLMNFFLFAPSSRPSIKKSCTRPALRGVSGLKAHGWNATSYKEPSQELPCSVHCCLGFATVPMGLHDWLAFSKLLAEPHRGHVASCAGIPSTCSRRR